MINTQNITVHGQYSEDSDHPDSARIEDVKFIDELRKQIPEGAQYTRYGTTLFEGDVTFFGGGEEVDLHSYDDNWWFGGFEVHHAKTVLIYWAKHHDTEMRVSF